MEKEVLKSGIYQIKNITNNKLYIGSSLRIKKRWQWHRSMLRLNKHYNSYLQNAWNKYGEKSFIFEILLEIKENLKENEQIFLDTLKPGYNIAKEARHKSGFKQITRKKGFRHSEESKEKMRLNAKQRSKPIIAFNDIETIYFESLSDARRKGFRNDLVLLCLNGNKESYKNYFWKYQNEGETKATFPTEMKKKLSDSHKNKTPVKSINVKTGEILFFESVSDASRIVNIKKSGIFRVLYGKRVSSGGYFWKYQNENDEIPQYKLRRQYKNNKSIKRVKRIDNYTGEEKEYKSVSDAVKDGFSEKMIYACCVNKRRTHKGFYWQYIENESKI